jgi:tRNA G10  N-methylase Trm11
MKQYFILGRNPELSRQEILSYLNARKQKFKEIFFENNYLLIELKKEIKINELGGTIKSGITSSEGSESTVESYIFANDLIQENKFSYALFGNTEPDLLKLKFKSEKRKAVLKHGRKKIRFQDKKDSPMPKADHYFFLHFDKDVFYFGKINQAYDSRSVEFRDMNKPQRREHLAISPRLAKILVNLSEAKDNNTLLDPFCGIGGIIQESLLKNINSFGIDNDKMAIYYAKKNMSWLQTKYKIKPYYNVKCQDARLAPNKQFDAIATETPLGEILRRKPQDHKAQQIIRSFERLIIPILRQLKRVKKHNAKIAITFPKIKNNGVDYDHILEETNLRIHKKPILESREKQFISREIVVFV